VLEVVWSTVVSTYNRFLFACPSELELEILVLLLKPGSRNVLSQICLFDIRYVAEVMLYQEVT